MWEATSAFFNRLLEGPALHFDLPILDWIAENLRCPALDFILKNLTQLGSTVAVIGLALLLLCFKKTRKMGLSVGIVLIFCGLFSNLLLKPMIGRIRPYDLQESMGKTVEVLIKRLTDGSFPSGHSVAVFGSAMAITLNDKRWGVLAFTLAVMVGFSRIYLYVHYVTDVLFGAALGILFGWLACLLANKIVAAIEAKSAKKSQ